MTFSEQLNEYLSVLNCSAKELSQISGLSNSVISRYRSGERVPRPESEKLNQLCEGIYLLSKEKAASKRDMYPQYWTPSIGGIFMKYSYEYKKKCVELFR